jgi:hypothetical protein
MTSKIIRVVHRHGDQRSTDPDLVLEVGKALPSFYQAGRRRGCTVRSIQIQPGGKAVFCQLDGGDHIFISMPSVQDIIRAGPND